MFLGEDTWMIFFLGEYPNWSSKVVPLLFARKQKKERKRVPVLSL